MGIAGEAFTVQYGVIKVLGKSGLVFPKLTNVTIHVNSTFNGNTRQNTNTK